MFVLENSRNSWKPNNPTSTSHRFQTSPKELKETTENCMEENRELDKSKRMKTQFTLGNYAKGS